MNRVCYNARFMDNIEDIVRSYVPLIDRVSSKGWNSVYCEVCGDGKRTKGPRGGWLFQDDMCFYNCFNCGVEGNFNPSREVPHSQEMYEIFRSFGIPSTDVNALLVSKLKDDKGQPIVRRPSIKLPRIPKPDFFKLLAEFPEDDVIAEEARTFIWDNYRMKDDDYPLFLSTGESTEDEKAARQLRPRIIIPAYHNKRMIYWQARLFIGESPQKYLSATVEDSNSIMFGMNNIYRRLDSPLYITEGFFDSWHLKGVSIARNTLSSNKITILERTRREKVVVPDYNNDGMNLAEQAAELEWGIALPEIFPCRDICQAILAFGKLYVLKSIVDNTYYGFEAKMRLKEFMLQNYNFLNETP